MSELSNVLIKPKRDLYQIIQIGSKLDFDNPIFGIWKSTNEFISRSAVDKTTLYLFWESFFLE